MCVCVCVCDCERACMHACVSFLRCTAHVTSFNSQHLDSTIPSLKVDLVCSNCGMAVNVWGF